MLIITTLLAVNNLYSQNIDTTFVIKTNNSEIKIFCKKESLNGLISNYTYISASINLSQNSLDEAMKTNVYKTKFYSKLIYKENCDLDKLEVLKISENNSFNNQIINYFNEFVKIYNENNLKQYFSESTQDCGTDKLVFTLYVE